VLRFKTIGEFLQIVIWLISASNKYSKVKSMENFIKISGHINNLIVCFGSFFNDDSMSRSECQKLAAQSSLLHRQLIYEKNLNFYDKHVGLAKQTYKIMLEKVKNQEVVDDIIFCGASDLPWEEASTVLRDLYGIDMHGKEIYAFYYLAEINNMLYIDSPLPSRHSVSF